MLTAPVAEQHLQLSERSNQTSSTAHNCVSICLYGTGCGSFGDAVPGHHGGRPRLGGGDAGGPGPGATAALAAQVHAAPRHVRVVVLAAVVGVEELLEPLDELKVVLEAALHQLVDRHDLKARARGQREVILILKRKQEHTFSDIYNVNKE